jgi:hypothetical protein
VKAICSKFFLSIVAVSLFFSLSVLRMPDQLKDSMEPDCDVSSSHSYGSVIELELLLEGMSPAFLDVGHNLKALYEIDDLADAETLPPMELHIDRAIQFFEAEEIEYSVGYCEQDSLTASLGIRHVCAGRDIKARLNSFQRPFFSTLEITILVRKTHDGRVGGYSIRG